jgi:hypothetical protein
VDDVPEIGPDAPLVLVSSQSTPTATDSDCWPEVFAAPSGPLAAASAVFADRLEAGFRSGNLNVYQWTFVNTAVP